MNLLPITPERFNGRRWPAQQAFRFAHDDTSVRVQVSEFPKACVSFPLAFIAQPAGYAPVALLGITNKENLFVGPQGQWLGTYIPTAYAQYPFFIAEDQHGKKVLAIDEDAPLMADADAQAAARADPSFVAYPFFDAAESKPSDAVMQVLARFAQIEADAVTTQTVCDLLEVHKLLEPWPLTIKMGDSEKVLEGLFRVSAEKLEALKSKPLAALHKEGALAAAFCQLVSMQQLRVLGQLFQQRRAGDVLPGVVKTKHESAEIDFSFLNE